MTNREFFVAVMKNENLPADLREHATAQLAKLDATNAKRAEQQSAKSRANEPLKQSIYSLLCENGAMTSPDIAEALNKQGVTTADGEEVSTFKASSMCRQMVEDGRLTVTEIKIPKKGKMKQYAAVLHDEVGEDDEVQATDYELNTMF